MTRHSGKQGRPSQSGDAVKDEAGDQPDAAQRIWQVVAGIPKGRVATYGQIAQLAGMPRHARLVGRTLRMLPVDTKLPWHRVVNASGRIATRAGAGPDTQRERLLLEGVEFIGERVPLRQFRWQPG
ncbi:MAG: methylated-DNA--[protein]-cysteine S-methyltransferase [Pseudomonadaceae bacterium]|nr:methylated-DNA--[protein]-cysteine S-methyltransferase [Pseudomonadaceae bacterium]